jgi:pimeloyl-ACP methyl ester carboxylesterase
MVPSPKVVAVGAERVGVYEYGAADGSPVLTFHGVPSCGAGFEWAASPAAERGLRILAPDRPGVGLSSRRARWTVREYPAMVAALADALGIERFAVWGYSGGGPYAVAAAALLGDRVTRTAVCAGMGEVGVFAELGDFEGTDTRFLTMAARRPRLARALLGSAGRLARLSPALAYRAMASEFNDADRAVLGRVTSDPADAMAMFTPAFLSGAHGVVADYAALGQPWGVDFGQIHTPVRVFQGTADAIVPERHAHELVARIAGAELVTWPGEGHLGTVVHVAQILDWLSGAA